MIVEAVPRLRTIILEVWRPLLVLFVWDCVVTGTYRLTPFHAPALPLTLLGSALALFLGFRSNSAYQRWWEGRVLWGAMINASRSLARAAVSFLPDGSDEARDLTRSIVLRHIAYVHALRHALRRTNPRRALYRTLTGPEADEPLRFTNIPNALLTGTGKRIDAARRAGLIDTILQSRFETLLIDITNAQGGMERLKNTPLPIQYRFLPTLFTRLFCVLIPIGLVETLGLATPIGSTLAGLMFLAALQIGDDLVDPFANTIHDVPLTAMCRTIEIDLKQTIGDEAPEPVTAKLGVLW